MKREDEVGCFQLVVAQVFRGWSKESVSGAMPRCCRRSCHSHVTTISSHVSTSRKCRGLRSSSAHQWNCVVDVHPRCTVPSFASTRYIERTQAQHAALKLLGLRVDHRVWTSALSSGREWLWQDLKFWLCPGCKRDAEEKERREQAEQLRLAAVMRTTAAANAVKVDAVKLPSEGEDGEDDSDDDDDDEEEDEAGDNGVKAEPGSEARAGARAVRDAENEESGALASPENSAAETKTEALAPSAVADTGEVVVREERKEYIAPAAATFVSGTGQLGGGNGDAIPASMQYTGDVHDKASTMPATPVGGVEASSWIGGASIRGLAGGTDTTSVEDEECVAEGGTGVSIARAEAKDADYSPDASDCGAAVVVGVPDPTIPGSDTKPSGAIVSNEGTKHKGTRIQDFVGQGVGTTTSGTSSAVFTSRPPAEQNAAHSEDGGR